MNTLSYAAPGERLKDCRAAANDYEYVLYICSTFPRVKRHNVVQDRHFRAWVLKLEFGQPPSRWVQEITGGEDNVGVR